jgi:hypothetical protein
MQPEIVFYAHAAIGGGAGMGDRQQRLLWWTSHMGECTVSTGWQAATTLASLGRIDRVVLRVDQWPRGQCRFRLTLRLGAAYADDESATGGDQGRRGR